MKNKVWPVLLATAFFLTACAKREGVAESGGAMANIDTISADTTLLPVPEPKQGTAVITVTGIVTGLNMGKDGYTAKLKTNDAKVYFATISIPNLDNPKQYRSVATGDTITVTGESFPIEEDISIKVTALK